MLNVSSRTEALGSGISADSFVTLQDNPLLFSSDAPIDFEAIQPEHVEPGIEYLLQQSYRALAKVVNSEKLRTFHNTVEAIDRIEIPLDRAWYVVSHLAKVNHSPELQDIVRKMAPKVSAFYSEACRGEGVWRALVSYSHTLDAKGLSPRKKRLLDLMIKRCRQLGADLPPEKRETLARYDTQLSELRKLFENAIVQSRAGFSLLLTDEERLKGLPPSAIDAAKQEAVASGHRQGWMFTLQPSSVLPVLRYAQDSELRREIYTASRTIASQGEHDNVPLAQRFIELRKMQADLLGKASFADLALEDRMARSPRAVFSFLTSLHQASFESFQSEIEMLRRAKCEHINDPHAMIHAWDTMYYANMVLAQSYSFSKEEVRPYFEVNQTLQGVIGLSQRLYGFQIEERSDLPVWHSSVRAYEIRESNGSSLGVFYADLYARPEKASGAWHSVIRRHSTKGIHYGEYVGCVSANFSEPTEGERLLLTHDQVRTLFHEFGHLMHKVMIDVPEILLREVPWDYIELPSQLMENFCWSKPVLDTFAKHIETGEPLPSDLFSRLVETRGFRTMTYHQERIARSVLDLQLHTTYDPLKDGDLLDFSRRQLEPHAQAELIADDAFVASFRHIFSGGYPAGYYAYLWGDVLQAEVFDAIFSPNELPARVQGDLLRKVFFAPGNSHDPLETLNTFMGRSPDAVPNPLALVGKQR